MLPNSLRFPSTLVSSVTLTVVALSSATAQGQANSPLPPACAQTPYELTSLSPALSLKISDINADGVFDLVGLRASSMGEISTMIGDGAGGFGFAIPSSLASSNYDVDFIVEDINGDGQADLLVLEAKVSCPTFWQCDVEKLRVYGILGDGQGSFGGFVYQFPTWSNFAGVTTALSQDTGSLILADCNGDGRKDLVLGHGSAKKIGVFLALPSGGYSPTPIVSSSDYVTNMRSADMNGDGWIDLVVLGRNPTASTSLTVLLGSGTGSFTAASSHNLPMASTFEIVDLDGNGVPEIASAGVNGAAGELYLLNPNGLGGYTLQSFPDPSDSSTIHRVASGDFDADSHQDLAVAHGSGTISVFLGNGLGGFSQRLWRRNASQNRLLTSGDFNTDGHSDLAMVSAIGADNLVQSLLAQGSGEFLGAVPTISPIPTNAFADLNEDGVPDLLGYESPSRDFQFQLGLGSAAFAAPTIVDLGLPSQSGVWDVARITVSAGDMDRDGHVDLVGYCTTPFTQVRALSWARGLGGGQFAAPVLTPLPWGNNGAYASKIEDVNRDGFPDLLSWNRSWLTNSRPLEAFLGNGFGGFVPVVLPPMNFEAHAAAIGDLNGDGLSDFAALERDTTNVRSFLADGLGGFVAGPVSQTPEASGSAILGDFSGDGFADLAAITSAFPKSAKLFLGDGLGSFAVSASVSLTWMQETSQLAVSDLNGDGHLDLLVGARILLGDGLGGLGLPIAYAVGSPALTADLDLDGRQDLLTSHGAILRNQLAMPAGISAFGAGTPGCGGIHGLNANKPPRVNTPDFTLVASNVPANALGLAISTIVPNIPGQDLLGLGVKFHVDLFQSPTLGFSNIESDAAGVGALVVPIPNIPALAGMSLYYQSFWFWDGANPCYPSPYGLSSSRGLAMTILP